MVDVSNLEIEVDDDLDDTVIHASFPDKYDFIQSPTLVGPNRALLYHKIRQFRYSRQQGFTVPEFLIKQIRKQTRKQMFSEWQERGNIGAKRLGIKLPEHLPVSGYGEIYGELMYEEGGFIPDRSSTVIDVGAQYGDYSVLCSKVYGAKEVYAFEPLESNLRAIKELIEVNNINNVTLYPVGLSDHKESKLLHYNGEMLSTNDNGALSQLFQFNTLDSYRISCDILKIDVEGFELKVLKGGLRTIEENMPRIIIEVHSRSLHKGAVGVLKGLGYKLAKKDHFSVLNGFNQNLFLEPLR